MRYLLLITAMVHWSSGRLNHELIPISGIESNFGKNQNHRPNPKGDWWTAVGALGMKPYTAYDHYLRSKRLQNIYPTDSREEFIDLLKSDQQFYTTLCNMHWTWLKKNTQSFDAAVYGWKWGRTAANNASDEQITNDAYVISYHKLQQAINANW